MPKPTLYYTLHRLYGDWRIIGVTTDTGYLVYGREIGRGSSTRALVKECLGSFQTKTDALKNLRSVQYWQHTYGSKLHMIEQNRCRLKRELQSVLAQITSGIDANNINKPELTS